MPDDETPPRFWLKAGDVPTGPFPAAAVHAKLAAGEVSWDTPACPVGGGAWRPLYRTPGVGPTDPPVVPLDPAVPDRPTAGPTAGDTFARPTAGPRAWNPAAIAGLSVLFTPLWGGVLGAVNAGRVGRPGRWWRPAAAGVVAMLVTFVPDWVVKYPPYWLDLGVYLAGVGLLWGWGLAQGLRTVNP